MTKFDPSPSKWIVFRDKEVLEKVRRIRRQNITKHPNADFNIQVVSDDMVEFIFVSDVLQKIIKARENGQRVVLILPNPSRAYIKLALLINRLKINCSHLYTFNMDEYADETGNIAPESYSQGFLHSIKMNLYSNIDEDLRPPESQITGPTNKNLSSYGQMIEDLGGADGCYSGPGWTGHIAFIEPDAPEFDADLETWKEMGPRIVTLSPFTIAQNSLHGSFGMSGDLAIVPPRAATIGPAQVIRAKARMDLHALKTDGTAVSWQRFASRLCLHGPVTPKVPTSILQILKTDVIVSETIAQDISPIWDREY